MAQIYHVGHDAFIVKDVSANASVRFANYLQVLNDVNGHLQQTGLCNVRLLMDNLEQVLAKLVSSLLDQATGGPHYTIDIQSVSGAVAAGDIAVLVTHNNELVTPLTIRLDRPALVAFISAPCDDVPLRFEHTLTNDTSGVARNTDVCHLGSADMYAPTSAVDRSSNDDTNWLMSDPKAYTIIMRCLVVADHLVGHYNDMKDVSRTDYTHHETLCRSGRRGDTILDMFNITTSRYDTLVPLTSYGCTPDHVLLVNDAGVKSTSSSQSSRNHGALSRLPAMNSIVHLQLPRLTGDTRFSLR